MKHRKEKIIQKAVCWYAVSMVIITAIILVLSGCGQDQVSSSSDAVNSIAIVDPANVSLTTGTSTTTLGTRGSTNVPNLPNDSNAGATWTNYTRAEVYPGVVTLPLQFITLTTGEQLAVLVSVPADANGKPVAGKFPAILTQTAYRIDIADLMDMLMPGTLMIGGRDDFMIKRGYVTVAVDILGSGMSGGQEQLLGGAEQQAYAEAVNWVTQQTWFNGNLGLAGTSYLAITSLLSAEQQNPAVKAVFAQVPMGDAYRGTVVTGGMPNALFISYWLPLTQMLSVLNGPAELIWPQYAAQIADATKLHIADINDWYLPLVNNALAGQTGYATDDGSFWSVRSPLEKAANIRVPTFIIGASHDIFQRDEPLLFEQLKRNVTTKLLILPGVHVAAVVEGMLGANNGLSNGAPGNEALLLQWFDQYLMGINTGAALLPNVTQCVDGYGLSGITRYASTTDWPHPLAKPVRMYLHGNLSVSKTPPVTAEATHTVSEPNPASIAYGVSSDGSTLTAKVTPNDGSGCSMSQLQWSLGIDFLLPIKCYSSDKSVETAQNALLYQTPILWSDLYINGPIQADIWMSTTATEAALSVRVDDVDPFGNVRPLTNGLMAASYRAIDLNRSRYINGVMIQPWHPFTAASVLPVIPGKPMLVPVEIFPTAALVRAGHRLRIAISSSNQAQGVWTSLQLAKVKGNVTTIYNSPAYPSSVVLPVVPASELR